MSPDADARHDELATRIAEVRRWIAVQVCDTSPTNRQGVNERYQPVLDILAGRGPRTTHYGSPLAAKQALMREVLQDADDRGLLAKTERWPKQVRKADLFDPISPASEYYAEVIPASLGADLYDALKIATTHGLGPMTGQQIDEGMATIRAALDRYEREVSRCTCENANTMGLAGIETCPIHGLCWPDEIDEMEEAEEGEGE